MKLNLNFFNPETTSKKKEKKEKIKLPQININIRAGLFRINELAAAAIGIDVESKVEFAQDGDQPQNWYLHISENGYPLHVKAEKISGFFFNNKILAVRIADSFQFAGKSLKLLVPEESVKLEGNNYWPLSFVEEQIQKAEEAA